MVDEGSFLADVGTKENERELQLSVLFCLLDLHSKETWSLSILYEKKRKPEEICLPISFRMWGAVMLCFNPFFFKVFALVSKGLEVILTDVVFPGCLWIVSFPTAIQNKSWSTKQITTALQKLQM